MPKVIPSLSNVITDPQEKLQYLLNFYMNCPRSHTSTMSKNKTRSLLYTLSQFNGIESASGQIENLIKEDLRDLIERNTSGGPRDITVRLEEATDVGDGYYNLVMSIVAVDEGETVALSATTQVTPEGILTQQFVG